MEAKYLEMLSVLVEGEYLRGKTKTQRNEERERTREKRNVGLVESKTKPRKLPKILDLAAGVVPSKTGMPSKLAEKKLKNLQSPFRRPSKGPSINS
ncbi:unnamed protein product [Dovyalis caffra]|uniref:Uncharacterized protein n=1 Tax=Dovyalis caffra TaxID=77055 RepID=A0AAV1R1B5_9ROSI|nr:unnamed protein product [Dovyalis caffra]